MSDNPICLQGSIVFAISHSHQDANNEEPHLVMYGILWTTGSFKERRQTTTSKDQFDDNPREIIVIPFTLECSVEVAH